MKLLTLKFLFAIFFSVSNWIAGGTPPSITCPHGAVIRGVEVGKFAVHGTSTVVSIYERCDL